MFFLLLLITGRWGTLAHDILKIIYIVDKKRLIFQYLIRGRGRPNYFIRGRGRP